ncbi:hypothetical protein RB195_005256 [Necator americanus]|uniref:TIL domain-containing protein n=1 Tax=Necator americanus TaxID=51031 RepID=A0ABR1BR23_NECAM
MSRIIPEKKKFFQGIWLAHQQRPMRSLIIILILLIAQIVICRRAKRCRKNEVYDECFNIRCEAKCKDRNPICTLECGPGGCKCRAGYFRNEKTNRCVRKC